MAKAGIQLYSIKELMGKDFYKSLADTAKCGFDGVELPGFIMKRLRTSGLRWTGTGLLPASHTAINLLNEDAINDTLRYNSVIGNESYMPLAAGEMRTRGSLVKDRRHF